MTSACPLLKRPVGHGPKGARHAYAAGAGQDRPNQAGPVRALRAGQPNPAGPGAQHIAVETHL